MEGERPDRSDDLDSSVATDLTDLTDVTEMRAALAQAEAEASEADALAAAARARVAGPDSAARTGPDSAARTIARRQMAGLAVAALLTAAAVTLTVLMLWQHGRVAAQRAQDQRFVDAAHDGILALLSIDHTHARADVQRVLDLSTGTFHDDFSHSADDFVKTAEGAQTVSNGSVTVAALASVDGDRAVVLVAATSKVSNANGARQDPRPFRINVTVTREGDTCKMSDVEFVP